MIREQELPYQVNDMMKIESSQTPPNLFEQVNYPKDPNNMTDLEKKHWPRIECPDVVEANKPFDVTVNVGSGIDHPSELAHFIEWIHLGRGDDNMKIGSAVLTPVFGMPRVTFKVKLDKSTTLIAREGCNLHGIWENKKKVAVK